MSVPEGISCFRTFSVRNILAQFFERGPVRREHFLPLSASFKRFWQAYAMLLLWTLMAKIKNAEHQAFRPCALFSARKVAIAPETVSEQMG